VSVCPRGIGHVLHTRRGTPRLRSVTGGRRPAQATDPEVGALLERLGDAEGLAPPEAAVVRETRRRAPGTAPPHMRCRMPGSSLRAGVGSGLVLGAAWLVHKAESVCTR